MGARGRLWRMKELLVALPPVLPAAPGALVPWRSVT